MSSSSLLFSLIYYTIHEMGWKKSINGFVLFFFVCCLLFLKLIVFFCMHVCLIHWAYSWTPIDQNSNIYRYLMFIILRNASSQSECVYYILLFQMKLKPLPMGYLCGCFVNIPDSLYKAIWWLKYTKFLVLFRCGCFYFILWALKLAGPM